MALITALIMGMASVNCTNIVNSPNPNSRTIVTFGDSTTAVYGYTYIYSDILRNETGYKVINSGVSGNDTSLSIARFNADVILNKPDVLIIQFGINDSMVDVWKTPTATHPRVSVDQYGFYLSEFIVAAHRIGSRVILMTPNPIYWRPWTIKSFGKPPYDVNSVEGFNVSLRKYADKVREVAAKYNVTLVDVDATYHLYSDPSAQLLDDGVHPNNAGHRLTATMIEGKL